MEIEEIVGLAVGIFIGFIFGTISGYFLSDISYNYSNSITRTSLFMFGFGIIFGGVGGVSGYFIGKYNIKDTDDTDDTDDADDADTYKLNMKMLSTSQNTYKNNRQRTIFPVNKENTYIYIDKVRLYFENINNEDEVDEDDKKDILVEKFIKLSELTTNTNIIDFTTFENVHKMRLYITSIKDEDGEKDVSFNLFINLSKSLQLYSDNIVNIVVKSDFIKYNDDSNRYIVNSNITCNKCS